MKFYAWAAVKSAAVLCGCAVAFFVTMVLMEHLR